MFALWPCRSAILNKTAIGNPNSTAKRQTRRNSAAQKVQKIVAESCTADEATPPVIIDEYREQREKINELIKDLTPFMEVGTCCHPENSIGWDVLFDMKFDEIETVGYIECELWNEVVGLPLIYKYYEKACKNQTKLSILVAKKIQVSLKKENHQKKAKTESKTPRNAKTEADLKIINQEQDQKQDQNENVKKLNQLWANGDNKINIYSISYKKETETASRIVKG